MNRSGAAYGPPRLFDGTGRAKSKGCPGDNLKFEVELIAPIAMEDGLRFAIREGGRTVSTDAVSKIIE